MIWFHLAGVMDNLTIINLERYEDLHWTISLPDLC
jgi:hypothetical protein